MDFLVHHMLRTSAARFPEHEALVHEDRRLSYAEAWQHTTSLAGGLQQAGVKRFDRVGVFLEPCLPLAVSLFAVSQAGGVFVPIHHSLLSDQVAHIVSNCGMKGLITDRSRLAGLKDVIAQSPSLEFVVVVDEDGPLPDRVRSYGYDELRAMCPTAPLHDAAIEKDLAVIVYTSGSTGKPKGVMLSHANMSAGASIVSDYLAITDQDRILAVLPFSFDAGLNQLTTAIQQGGTCVLMKFLFAKEIVAMLAKEKITGLAGVPPLWSLLAQTNSKLSDTPLDHLRYITNTGGAMPLDMLEKLRQALPATKVFLMYGLTEAFRSTYLPPEELDRRPGSMGKAIPDTEIIVVNDDGKPCRPGEIGELVHHGPTVSLGYWGEPELTDRVIRPHPFLPAGLCEHTNVCYSGDLVKTDEDGFIYFVGRRDNLIKSAGFRVSPTEVEEGLLRSGKLRLAAVIGISDGVIGQQIKAFVVPNEGESVDENELLEVCATVMPRHMIPRSIEILDELPKTSSGKIDYPALRQYQDQ